MGLILQRGNASSIFLLIARPLVAHFENSLYQGKELVFTIALGGNSIIPFFNIIYVPIPKR
jgi:hypothetical protein